MSDKIADQRARRAASRIGLQARRSRWRHGSIDNHGGFMIIDPARNWVVAGSRYELSADDVIEYCEAGHGRAA
jgi:hypothetical protein